MSLRISRSEAAVLTAASRQAKLPLGAFVSEFSANAALLAEAARRPERIAALVASAYQAMLATLNADVRGHLDLAAEILAILSPPTRTRAARRHAHY